MTSRMMQTDTWLNLTGSTGIIWLTLRQCLLSTAEPVLAEVVAEAKL